MVIRSNCLLLDVLDVYFATQAEHKYKCKYRIKTSKNNKKKKPNVPDRRTDKTREYKTN